MPVHILHGPDEFRASEALGELRRSLDSDGMLENNTSRLEGRCEPGEILMSATAAASLPQRFETEDIGEVYLRGKGKIGVYRLLGRTQN